MEAKDASTIVLIRDAQRSGLKVLMLERNTKSGYVPGAHLFPGGEVDEVDKSSDYIDICTGIKGGTTNRNTDPYEDDLPWRVAAIRECFEEVGMLLTDPEPNDINQFVQYRAIVTEHPDNLITMCREENIKLATDRLHYFSHWITPHGAPRRYDTRFFLAVAPGNQLPIEDKIEIVKTIWITPEEALRAHEEGSFGMLLPTVKVLETIGEFKDAKSLIDWADDLEAIPSIQPRVRMYNGEMQVLIPGDEGYDDTSEYPPEDLSFSPSKQLNTDQGGNQ